MTIKEIAQLCGVSRGTVDRVLNKRGRVKPETEALILRTIKQMGYTKNIAGRALTVKRDEPVIGAVLCSEGNSFFDDIIQGFHNAISELVDYGITLSIRTMRGHNVDKQLELIDEISDHITALVIQPINDPRIAAKIRELRDQGIPTITVNNDIENSSRCCYVGSDYAAGGATAAGLMRLITGGEANLAIVTGVDSLMGHVQRLEGFVSHLRTICPNIKFVDCESGHDNPEHSYEATKRMLQRHPEIDTLFIVAAGSYGMCRAVIDLGREDIRIIAYDDVPSTQEMMRRGLIKAVVCQQPLEQGYRAIRIAFDMILSDTFPNNEQVIMQNQIKIAENL